LRHLAAVLERTPNRASSTWADQLKSVENEFEAHFESQMEQYISGLWIQLGDFTLRELHSER
jgi:hypothetical protein